MPSKNLKNTLDKVVINTGVGRLSSTPSFEEKGLKDIINEFSSITGQKPSTRAAKISIAGFKLRSGSIVGLKATLRGSRMKEFVTKLNSVVIPRLRDFRGISLGNIDTNGNLSIGFKEHVVFPEVSQENTKVNFGLQVTFVPKFQDYNSALTLYRELGVPLKKEVEPTKKKK